MSRLEKTIIILAILLEWSFPCGLRADDCDKAWEWLQEATASFHDVHRQTYCLEKALDLCPLLVEAKLRLGKIHMQQGRLGLARREFEQVKIQILSSDFLMSQPGSKQLLVDSMLNTAEIYRMQGKLEEAASQLEKLLESFPDCRAAQNNLQYIYKRLHNFDLNLLPYHRMVTNPSFNRISAFPMPRGKLLFDTLFRFWHQTATIADDMYEQGSPLFYPAEERSVHVKTLIMGMRYAVTDKLTMGIIGKYFWKTVDVNLESVPGPDAKAEFNVSGFGDTVFFTKYHLWGKRKTHLAFFHLLSIPTGDQNAIGKDKDVRQEDVWRWIPLGSGSVDFMPGLALSTELNKVQTNINVSYKFTNGQHVGDEFNMGAAFLYPLNPSVYGDLEFNYRWRGHVRRKQHILAMKGRPDVITPQRLPGGPVPVDTWVTDKGGNSLFISPCLQFFVAEGLKLEIGGRVPLVKQENGWIEDYVIHAGLSKRFF